MQKVVGLLMFEICVPSQCGIQNVVVSFKENVNWKEVVILQN